MQIVSPTNEINYGSYDEGLYWNSAYNAKNFAKCVRFNIFAASIQAEIEFLCSNNTLRILLVGYDLKHDLYLEKTWLLTNKHFRWEGSPKKFQILGKGLGLELNCVQQGSLQVSFRYFDQYHLAFSSEPFSKPLCNVNPYDINHWSYNEKQAMLDCERLELVLDGNNYAEKEFNLAYEWLGGQLPKRTQELRCSFWQAKIVEGTKTSSRGIRSSRRTEGLFASSDTVELKQNSRKQIAGALLLMGHDSCSSESAVWVEEKVRYRLPRITPSFSRSSSASLLPDLEWKIKAGEHFELSFCPFGLSDAPQLVFPNTKTQRIYGLFYGKLLSEIRKLMPIQGALGFIDFREIQWHK